jgi:protein-L-isoaspartate(D-aspartate) O-methyltransferase
VAPGELETWHRNEQLVAQLEASGTLTDSAVAAAFRVVRRHHFLPGRPLEEVYADSAITTKTGEHGVAVSSSSQPAIMAIMLQLLRPQPGQRVLEIGAGTGYNAAVIARLVGAGGRVVTMDIDPDVTRQARANLASAGFTDVEVVEADGAGGWPRDAPYDRVIVTACADDLSLAWLEQLVEGGRLVLPLALTGSGQQCVGFVRQGRALVSTELCMCGFIPLRGEMAPGPGRADAAIATWLAGDGRPTGHAVPVADLRAGFEVWLALTENGYVRTRSMPAFGLREKGGLALVVGDEDERRPVTVFGEGDAAARHLVEVHRAWSREHPSLDSLRVTALPADEAPAPPAGVRTVRRPRFTFVVSGT